MEDNETSYRKDQQNQKWLKEFCPFVEDPHEDCYCFDRNSLRISKALHYCRENFRECEIYERILKRQGKGNKQRHPKSTLRIRNG